MRAFPVIRLLAVLMIVGIFVQLRWDAWPKTYFADELIPLKVVQFMEASGTLDTNWDHADWHGDYAGNFYDLQQYNFSSYHVALRVLKALAAPWQGAVPDIVLYRFYSVLFQLFAVLLVMMLVKDMLRCTGDSVTGVSLAMFASLLLSVWPQAVIDAHYARPETFVTMLVSLALWLGWCSCRAQQWVWQDTAAALVWGVAFACKISLLPMALTAALFLVVRRLNVPLLALWGLLFVVGFAVSAPYAFSDPKGFLTGAGFLWHQYSPDVTRASETTFSSAKPLMDYWQAFFGVPTGLLMLLSVKSPQRSLRTVAWVCLAATVFYIVFFSYQKVFFERNLSHLMPLWALLAALGASRVLAGITAITTSPPVKQGLQAVFWLLLAAVIVDRVWLSCGIVDTFFRGSTVIATRVAEIEKTLLTQDESVRGKPVQILRMKPVQDFMRVDEFPTEALLQVPRFKLPEQMLLDARLKEAGWVSVARLALPFGFLPYNQLQINHAPIAYDYYRKIPAAKVP